MSANASTVLSELKRLANPINVAGMARFGIVGKKLLGITSVQLRTTAKRIGCNHELAEELWSSGIFEARTVVCCRAPRLHHQLRHKRTSILACAKNNNGNNLGVARFETKLTIYD